MSNVESNHPKAHPCRVLASNISCITIREFIILPVPMYVSTASSHVCIHCKLCLLQGREFYLVILYLLSGFLVVSVGMCVWVAWCFKNDHFPFLWPIQVLRVVVSLFFGMTYIVSLNIFIMMLVCVKTDGTWIHSIYLDGTHAFYQPSS
jgi:hypothetical protein